MVKYILCCGHNEYESPDVKTFVGVYDTPLQAYEETQNQQCAWAILAELDGTVVIRKALVQERIERLSENERVKHTGWYWDTDEFSEVSARHQVYQAYKQPLVDVVVSTVGVTGTWVQGYWVDVE